MYNLVNPRLQSVTRVRDPGIFKGVHLAAVNSPNTNLPIINFCWGNTLNNSGVPENTNTGAPSSTRAIASRITSEHDERYVASGGFGPLVEQIARRQEIDTRKKTKDENVVVLDGGTHVFSTLNKYALHPESEKERGTAILMPEFPYAMFIGMVRDTGCVIFTYESKGDGQPDLDRLEHQIQEAQKKYNLRYIYINSPSNPLTTYYTEETLKGIIALAKKYEVMIVSDEVYYGVVMKGHETKVKRLAELNNEVPEIQIDSASKRYRIPGARIGWGIAINFDAVESAQWLWNGMMREAGFFLCAPSAFQELTSSLIPNTDQLVREFVEIIEAKQRILQTAFREVPGIILGKPPTTTYYWTIEFVPGFSKLATDREIIFGLSSEKRLELAPLGAFYSGPPGKQPFQGARIMLNGTEQEIYDAAQRFIEFQKDHMR